MLADCHEASDALMLIDTNANLRLQYANIVIRIDSDAVLLQPGR